MTPPSGQALQEATGSGSRTGATDQEPTAPHAIVLGSGNLGLVYLMEEKRRLTAEEIGQRHPGVAGRAWRAPRHRLSARALG